jgi:hypothetical protein
VAAARWCSKKEMHDGLDSNARRSSEARSPLQLWTFSDFQADRKWQEMPPPMCDLCSEPKSEGRLAYKKEIEALIDSNTFTLDATK